MELCSPGCVEFHLMPHQDGGTAMPALFGFILGVVVTIAGAYLYDSSTGRAANGLATATAPMVNWNVVTDDWHSFATGVHNTASDLESRLRRHTG
jgi:hypothetical protein